MEKVEINGNVWQKSIGDEGQDVYVAEFLIESEELLGKHVDDSFYDILVEKDTDVYLPPECSLEEKMNCDEVCINCLEEKDLAFKFRKDIFSQEEQKGAVDGLISAATESFNRGLAAGQIGETNRGRDWVSPLQAELLDYFEDGQKSSLLGTDRLKSIYDKFKDHKATRGIVWLRGKVVESFGEYEGAFDKIMDNLKGMSVDKASQYATKIKKEYISRTTYAEPIYSGISGFYGRYPRIPYGRQTAHTEHNRKEYEKSYPFARTLDKHFKKMLPERYSKQQEFADNIDKRFLIGENTTFTTVTVNTTTHDKNARMACHRDAGSLNEGFSNLTVVTKDGQDWKGGYLVTPQVRMAINVRPGDLLLIDNMRIIHGNTPIEAPDSGKENMLRMSLIFYFREDMAILGSWEYEALRKQFVDDRRLNKDHPEWRLHWNGVSPGLWDSREWYDYLKAHENGDEWIAEYHQNLIRLFENKTTKLGDFM